MRDFSGDVFNVSLKASLNSFLTKKANLEEEVIKNPTTI